MLWLKCLKREDLEYSWEDDGKSMFLYLSLIDDEEDKSKFEIIYREYRQLMYYVADRILGDTKDSEDVVHDAFLKIIEHIEKISDPKCPQTRYFVVTIVERKAIDLYRQRQRRLVQVTCSTT